MASTSQQRSFQWLGAIGLLAAVAAINPLTVPWLQAHGLWPVLEERLMHGNDARYLLPLYLDTIALAGAVVLLRGRSLTQAFSNSLPFVLVLLFSTFGLLLSTNVIRPGGYILVRILIVLTLLVLLTQTLNLAVIRERPKPIAARWKNIGLTLYSIFLTLFLLEIAFMFIWRPHRYNGSLSSRAWFRQHWQLNSEGYRDVEYDEAKIKGKRRVLLAGDSFAAGHGVEKVEDRMSERLALQLPESDYVFNMGVPGADVNAALGYLKSFPYSPDLLIFNYYPNDIELDGQANGREMARFKSYVDIPLPVRFLVRRSYMANYLYWRFPHSSETFDYKAYLDDSYHDEAVMALHTAHLDSLVDFARQHDAPMVAVVWPLLENVPVSKVWTGKVAAHFRSRGVPTIDVATFTEGRDPLDMMANVSDSHANAAMHHELADSLAALLKREKWY